jgi:hypothetical protein
MPDSPNDIDVMSLAIYDELGEKLIDFAEENTNGRISLGIMEFVESIGETSIRGVVSVDTTKGEFESLQLTGNETLQFVLKTIVENEDENEEDFIVVSPEFKIYDFDESSDHSDLTLLPEGVHSRIVTLKFSSKQESSVFDAKSPLQNGFVGKISVDQIIDLNQNDGEEEPTEDEPVVCPGLINELAGTYFSGERFEIEGTDNSIMISPKKFTYPNKKLTKNMNLLQLINYATNYAWKKSNETVQGEDDSGTSYSEYGWSNYFFWQDLDGWHFKSANKMAADSKDGKKIKKYSFNQDVLSSERIRKLDVISDFSIARAFSDGMLYSYYKRIEPNYNDIYARFLSEDKKYNETTYEYNYGKDYSPIIEEKRMLPDIVFDPISGKELTLPEWIKERKNNELKIEDNLFGHYNFLPYNDKKDLYRIIGRGSDVDAGFQNEASNVLSNSEELADYTLYQDNMWQEMFDCVDIMGSYEPAKDPVEPPVEEPPSEGFSEQEQPTQIEEKMDDCSVLRKIKEIKARTFKNKALYKRALEYKEKWNVYRYSICCEAQEQQEENSFFAIIKDHKKIAPNIYRYSWSRVVLIPKAELSEVVGYKHFLTEEEIEQGLTTDSAYYSREVSGEFGLNAMYFFEDFDQIFYRPHYVTPPAGYRQNSASGLYSGQIFFAPVLGPSGCTGENPGPGCSGASGPTGSIAFQYIKDLFSGGESAEGLTLTFHNSQYSPFLVVEKENSAKGRLDNYTGAYNLNEIMNRKLLPVGEYTPEQGKYPENYEGITGLIYYQHSPIEYPLPPSYDFSGPSGPTFTNEILIGPGIQGTGPSGGYPDAFDMMPIGGYKRLLDDDQGIECVATPFGHVVKMASVSYEDALKVGIEPRNFPVDIRKKRFFYFSAENAHDGNCNGECEL